MRTLVLLSAGELIPYEVAGSKPLDGTKDAGCRDRNYALSSRSPVAELNSDTWRRRRPSRRPAATTTGSATEAFIDYEMFWGGPTITAMRLLYARDTLITAAIATDQTEMVFICGLSRKATRGPDDATCFGVRPSPRRARSESFAGFESP